jgi:hypothetical protein
MAANDKAGDKKSMDDVAKPGKSTPDTSARPVVISHRPMVQDRTVKSTDKPEPSKLVPARSDKVIKPMDETMDTAADADKTAEPETKAKTAASDKKSEPETVEETSSSDEAVMDAVVDQATADKKKQNELTDAEQAKLELVAKLTADKKYFVPIGQVAKRRHRRTVIIVAVLLFIAAGAYLAAKAGVI